MLAAWHPLSIGDCNADSERTCQVDTKREVAYRHTQASSSSFPGSFHSSMGLSFGIYNREKIMVEKQPHPVFAGKIVSRGAIQQPENENGFHIYKEGMGLKENEIQKSLILDHIPPPHYPAKWKWRRTQCKTEGAPYILVLE